MKARLIIAQKEFVVMRDISQEECWWLERPIFKGEVVYQSLDYKAHEISPIGVAVTSHPNTNFPYFELPKKALLELSRN